MSRTGFFAKEGRRMEAEVEGGGQHERRRRRYYDEHTRFEWAVVDGGGTHHFFPDELFVLYLGGACSSR